MRIKPLRVTPEDVALARRRDSSPMMQAALRELDALGSQHPNCRCVVVDESHPSFRCSPPELPPKGTP